ncbi:MAG: FAD-dependent oxidoreductase [Thermoguttaceae bacterium]|jgi:ribulose 1,5-bisphosphate synthetase/thiazole synthase|nr:FAD-dependent oxidoreductase [Thermoguttaceae bacterium]
MPYEMNRRDWLRAIGATGALAGLGAQASPAPAADRPGESSGFTSSILARNKVQDSRFAPSVVDGKVIQPQRELPVLHTTEVLVVGGGPAGVAAAIAARRAGAEVTLVERYGHFGGLWTGGLVLLVIGHIVKGGKQVCQGIGEEMMRRLEKLDGGIIDRRPGVNPTVDAEALKYVMVEMVEEAGLKVFLHSWGVDAILNGNEVRGAVFESKSGRQAILAKVVVDATGDGDLFAAAGAEFEHRSHNVGLVSRIGNVDQIDRGKAGKAKPRRLGGPTPAPGINWVNLVGPEVDGLDVATLTRLELNHRKFIWRDLQKTRQMPGYEKLFLVETAPQLGVRITRVLNGLHTVTLADLKAGTRFPDVVAVGGSSNGSHGEWQVPYGALVPKKIDHVLAAGRCISAEMRMADLVRLIPNCFATGHAAGVAAAVAVKDGCRPRDVEVAKVQKILRQQEAYLGS